MQRGFFGFKAKKKNRTSTDRENVDFYKAKLSGCDFTDSALPLFPLPKTKDIGSSLSSAKPCWLQHEQAVEYANSSSANAVSNVNTESSSPASSDSELSFEIDELSEYFQHFVNVRLKMSMQAESMYV